MTQPHPAPKQQNMPNADAFAPTGSSEQKIGTAAGSALDARESSTPTEDRSARAQGDGGRPVIYLSHHPDEPHRDLCDVIADAARALGENAEDVYCRDGRLVDAGPVDIFLGKDGRKPKTTVGAEFVNASETAIFRIL